MSAEVGTISTLKDAEMSEPILLLVQTLNLAESILSSCLLRLLIEPDVDLILFSLIVGVDGNLALLHPGVERFGTDTQVIKHSVEG